MPDQTADELLRLAASAGVPVAAVIATPPPAPPRKRASERTRSRPLRRPARADRRHGHPPGRHAEWGFQGSGPAQLALALLLDHTGDPDLAQTHHQRFKADVVARWRGKEWTLEPREIDAWLAVATA